MEIKTSKDTIKHTKEEEKTKEKKLHIVKPMRDFLCATSLISTIQNLSAVFGY